MKSKLQIFAGTLLILVATETFSPAQGFGGGGASVPTPSFDPATGMPIAAAVPDWKDADWKDPDITLTNVLYDNLPLSEVAKELTDQFKQQFDVLLPGNTSSVVAGNGQVIPTAWQSDWRSEPISLQLRNVTASEIFAAMNLLFENNRTPLRWELKLNGHRQIALLRVLVDPTPQGNAIAGGPAPEMQRRVYFVGNLIGDEKNGGMTMEQIIKTVTDVWSMSDPSSKGVTTSTRGVEISGGTIQFHKDAQLLVVTGTSAQIDFMEQTLKALMQKVDHEKTQRAERPSSSGETKSVSPGR